MENPSEVESSKDSVALKNKIEKQKKLIFTFLVIILFTYISNVVSIHKPHPISFPFTSKRGTHDSLSHSLSFSPTENYFAFILHPD